jgi:di/tricarboxylate transporter
VHLGLLMFVAAAVLGPALAGLPLRDVVGGFPVNILILVAGVTYFFGIAHLNGTLGLVMDALVARTGGRRELMPVLCFLLAAVMAAMGSPQAGLATGPVGMSMARQARVDPVLMAIAINSGICAGSFAPTSLFGVITYTVARQSGIDVSAAALFGVAILANLVLFASALVLFTRRSVGAHAESSSDTSGSLDDTTAHTPISGPLSLQQKATTVCLVGLVPGILVAALLGVEPDIGVVLLSLGAVLAFTDPALGTRAFARIDWSTAFVVGGIVTYVGVLQSLDAVNLLGRQVTAIGTPLVAAVGICMIAALVSAFASTTAVLAALVPMAVPLAATGAIPGWALITTLGVSATVVDVSPFSNTGATLIAAASDGDRPRLRVMLLRWSMAMVVVGPLVLLPLLMALAD